MAKKAEQKVPLVKYASKHGNTATVKKADFRGWRLGESTIHLFNKCYIEVLKKAKT